MDFGMPTLLECAMLADSVHLAHELGLKFVEINMNLPVFQVGRLEKLPIYNDIYYTIHIDEALNPFDFNNDVACAYAKTAKAALSIARERGIPVLNMHMPEGVHFTMPNGKIYLFDMYWDTVRGKILRFRDEMTNGDVKICIENTAFGRWARHTEALEILLESPSFMLTYDAGHDFTDGLRAESFYKKYSDRIYHLHLHGSTAKSCHLPLSEGEMKIEPLLSIGASRAVLETKTVDGLKQSVSYLRERNII